MQRKHLIYLTISLFLVLSLVTTISYAQEEEMAFHGLEPENNAFQDAFFAALRYKAIGNYRLALQALDKAEIEAREEKEDRKSTRLNSSHVTSSYAVLCLKNKKKNK